MGLTASRAPPRGRRREGVQHRGLAGARAAGHEYRRAGAHARGQEGGQRLGQRPLGHQVLEREPLGTKPADGEAGTVERERRDDDVHARTVGQAGVAERRGLVHAATERRQDALYGVPDLRLAAEGHVTERKLAGALDVHRPGAVDHHLVDGRVLEQGLERPQSRGQPHDPIRERLALRPRQRGGLAVDERAHVILQALGPVGALARPFDQPRPERGGELLEWVHTALSTAAP